MLGARWRRPAFTVTLSDWPGGTGQANHPTCDLRVFSLLVTASVSEGTSANPLAHTRSYTNQAEASFGVLDPRE